MIIPEDGDIKIFVPESKADQDASVLSYVEGMAHHRKNGNVDKAKSLGEMLAVSIDDKEENKNLADKIFLKEEYNIQIFALMLFSVEAALNYYLPSQQLSTISINTLHEKLSEKKRPTYESIIESPAFSFYYLSVRKGGEDIPRDVGEAFAMLCHMTNNEDFIKQGSNIYLAVLQNVEAKILSLKFEN